MEIGTLRPLRFNSLFFTAKDAKKRKVRKVQFACPLRSIKYSRRALAAFYKNRYNERR